MVQKSRQKFNDLLTGLARSLGVNHTAKRKTGIRQRAIPPFTGISHRVLQNRGSSCAGFFNSLQLVALSWLDHQACLHSEGTILKTRTLTVSTSFWSARCRWIFRDSEWQCVIMDKELAFLKGLTPEQSKIELENLKARWQWGPVEDREPPVIS